MPGVDTACHSACLKHSPSPSLYTCTSHNNAANQLQRTTPARRRSCRHLCVGACTWRPAQQAVAVSRIGILVFPCPQPYEDVRYVTTLINNGANITCHTFQRKFSRRYVAMSATAAAAVDIAMSDVYLGGWVRLHRATRGCGWQKRARGDLS